MAMAQRSSLISSEKVEGTNVYDTQGNKIGEIDHLMIDRVSGNVRYAVMSFGGFLGIGHSHYPLPWQSFRYDTGHDGFVAQVTETQLRDLPEYSDDSWSDPEWEAKLYRQLGMTPYWEGGASGTSSTSTSSRTDISGM